MAISLYNYPLTLPSSLSPTSFSITPYAVISASRSPYTLSTQFYQRAGQTWNLSIDFPSMTPEQARDFQAFFVGLSGQRGTFYFGDYLQASPRGVATGSPKINNVTAGEILSTYGWTPSVENIMRVGDWIQLGSRLHMVMNDPASNGSGEATLEIWPAIRREGVVHDQEVIVYGAKGTWRLTRPDNGWSVALSKSYSFSLQAEEAL